MNRYRVYGGIANVGPGQVMELSGEQIRRRANSLELPKDYQRVAKDPKAKGDFKLAGARVVAKAALQFKVGEIIGLPDVPGNLIDKLAPLDGVKTEADAKAAETALLKTNPKAHAAEGQRARQVAAAAKAKR